MSQPNYDLIIDLIQAENYAQARQLLEAGEIDDKAAQWLALLERAEQGEKEVLGELGLIVQEPTPEKPSLTMKVATWLNRVLDVLFDN